MHVAAIVDHGQGAQLGVLDAWLDLHFKVPCLIPIQLTATLYKNFPKLSHVWYACLIY